MRRGLATQSPATLNEPRKRRRKSSHGFPGVRGGQGRGRDQFQGCLPYKEKVTDLCDTPEEAYAALQILEKEKREAEQKVPDYGWQGAAAAASRCQLLRLRHERRVLLAADAACGHRPLDVAAAGGQQPQLTRM